MKILRKDYYSITDIALMTSLSTRTIRTYIKNGLLNGSKKDGAWVFSEEDIEKFFHEPFVIQGVKIKYESMVRDFMDNRHKSSNSVCFIFDYLISSIEEAEALCDKIIEQINLNNESSADYGKINFSFNYDDKINIVRIIITGEAETALKIIQKCLN